MKFKSIGLLLILFLVLTLNSCYESIADRSIPNISISKGELNGDLPANIDSVFSTLDFICLETSKIALLGRLSKIEVYDSILFIKDETGDNRLMLFTNQGKFLKQIGNRGKGPQEYVELTDFTIDRATSEVLILCAPSKSILVYNTEGQFIKRIVLQIKNNLFGPNRIGASCRFYYIESIGFYPNLAVFDGKGNLVGQHFKNERGLIHLNLPLTYSARGVIYHKPFNDTIYSLEKTKLSPLVYIDYGKFKIDYRAFEKIGIPNPVYPSYREMPKEFCELDEIFLTKHGIIIVTKTGGIYCLSAISNDGGEVQTFREIDFKQILGVPLTTPKAFDEDDYLYSYYYPHQLLGLLNSGTSALKNKCECLDSINESSNPIIMKFKLK